MAIFNFDELKNQLQQEVAAVRTKTDVERLRIKYIGRKGIMAEASKAFKLYVDPVERKKYGRSFGIFKTFSTKLLEDIFILFEKKEKQKSIDFSLPGRTHFLGNLHPLTQIQEEVINTFRGMGFAVEVGPEVESVFFNFDALNTPQWHPARDLTDTFYIDMPGEERLNWLLRTETSPVQIRVMQREKPPIRIIAPGRVYRSDKPDATHTPIFMQVEGLYVDQGVDFADLKGTVLSFYQSLFGLDIKTRFRPHFFPFTEPSAEVDMSCIFCSGVGCRICKNTGWLEMGGSGMVDPKVLEGVGIDSEKYTGWAFGLGIERIAMLKYGVTDIRMFYENDLRFLNQF